ncbi:MAG: ABC transporter permease [Parasporobacterium sp.]|nr:ABC transporter permease [Parasporobacterium sp.]
MWNSIVKAFNLIISLDPELLNILGTTAKMSLSSSLIALIIGVPIGLLYGYCRFKGRGVLIVINRTLMGMPPVVCGLIFYLLFSGVGPFRHLKLLFTVELMVMAQVVLITPIIISTMETWVSQVVTPFKETCRGLKLKKGQVFGLLLKESSYSVISAYLLAFSRAIAEVGAISMVGGAIAWKTNVMTTAIMQYTNMGNFSLGIALGLILMVLALIINIVISLLQKRVSR